MTEQINTGLALDLMRQVVSEFGEAHEVDSNGCYYVKRTSTGFTPSCLVGQALTKHYGLEVVVKAFGADREDVSTYSPDNVGSNGTEINMVPLDDLREAGIDLSAEAVAVFTAAQDVQDGREGSNGSWGRALEAAIQEAADLARL